jgi:type II secretory pathway component PulC
MAKSILKFFDDLMLEETIAPWIYSQKGRYAGISILAVAGILFSYTLISMFINWYGDFTLTKHAPATNINQNSNDSEAQLIASISNQHLFGQAPIEDTDFLPITSLQLHLTGIEKNTQDNLSKVIISQAGQPGKVYTVGDEIAEGIKINAINNDSIVLSHEGRFEKLPLGRAPLLFSDLPKAMWNDVA